MSGGQRLRFLSACSAAMAIAAPDLLPMMKHCRREGAPFRPQTKSDRLSLRLVSEGRIDLHSVNERGGAFHVKGRPESLDE